MFHKQVEIHLMIYYYILIGIFHFDVYMFHNLIQLDDRLVQVLLKNVP